MKSKKKLCIVSFICVGAGIIILGIGMFLGGRPGFRIDQSGVHTAEEVVKVTAVEESKKLKKFSSMDISTEYADVEIVPSDRYAIEYRVWENKKGTPVCEVQDGKLVFREVDEKIGGVWNFSFSTMTTTEKTDFYVKVYVPADAELSSVKINTEDGKQTIPDIKASSLEISNEYGNVDIESFQGDRLKADLDDGNMTVNAIDAGYVEISNAYGDVRLKDMKADALSADLDDGHFLADRLSCSDVDIRNEYGDVTVGMTANIKEYALDLVTEYGDINIPRYHISSGDDEMEYKIDNDSGKKIRIHCEDGDIEIREK